MRTPLVLLFLAVMAILFRPQAVTADGAVFSLSSLQPLREKEQMAAIVHRDGTQKMVIAVNFDVKDAESAVWIFPVPRSAQAPKIDLVDTFPKFRGRELRDEAYGNIKAAMFLARATQIYPYVFEPFLGFLLSGGSTKTGEVEKWGLRAETFRVKSVDDLAICLRQKQPGFAAKHVTAFADYCNDNYELVVVWVQSRQQYQQEFPQAGSGQGGNERRPCVYVEFATPRAFYPLRPTRIYGNEVAPVRLFIVGHVKVETTLNRLTDVSYCLQSEKPTLPAQFVAELPGEESLDFTVIRLETTADSFRDDLWFVPMAPSDYPPNLAYARRVLAQKGAWGVFLTISMIAGLCYVSGGLAGYSVFGRWQLYALLGLANLGTILGLLIALLICRRCQNAARTRAATEPSPSAADLPPVGTNRWQANKIKLERSASFLETRRFLSRFSIYFVVGTILLQVVLSWPLSK